MAVSANSVFDSVVHLLRQHWHTQMNPEPTDPNFVDEQGWTRLAKAAYRGETDKVVTLVWNPSQSALTSKIKAGADPNMKTPEGISPLYVFFYCD